VSPVDEVVEGVGGGWLLGPLLDLPETDIIDDEQRRASPSLEPACVRAIGESSMEVVEQVDAACVAHADPLLARRVHVSGLVERKALEAFDWNFQPKLDKALVLELARLDFVRRRDDLVITGKTGTGKSHILKAFALRACWRIRLCFS
jgi:hypothetical protein